MTDKINEMPTLAFVEKYVSIYGSFVLTTLGIIGNIVLIFIYLSPKYRRQSLHFYLLSLALCDLCFIIIHLIEDTFRNHNSVYKSRINILDHSSPIICIFVEYARNTTHLLSSWIVVAFTIEHLLVVFYPLEGPIICRRKIARIVVFILFLISLLLNINIPFHYGISIESDDLENDTICDILPKYRSIYMRFAISTMITVFLLPMCIIGIVNTLTCCRLWRKSLLTEKDENNETLPQREDLIHSSLLSQFQSVGPLSTTGINTLKMDETPLTGEGPRALSNVSANHSTNVKSYIQSRTSVTVTLLLVSCSFLLLNSPYCVVWIANYIHGFKNATLRSIKEITELFMLTTFFINILLFKSIQ